MLSLIHIYAVLIATALGGGLVTIAMGLFVNYPIALAPGVGLLAFYSFTVVPVSYTHLDVYNRQGLI